MKFAPIALILSGFVLAIFAIFIPSSPAVFAAVVTSTWSTATSGNWNVDAKWTNAPAMGGFPNNGNGGVATYDAVINAVGSPYTVALNTNVTLEDLLLNSANATLSHTSGTLTATGAINLAAGTYSLAGGTIANSTVNATVPVTLTGSGGTLSGVTVNGDLSFPAFNSEVVIAGGTTFTTAHLAGNYSAIGFAPAQTLSGTIQFEPGGDQSSVTLNSAGNFTIGATGVIKTLTGLTGDVSIGSGGFAYNAAMALTNNGLISSQVSGRTLTINPVTSFANGGTLEAINGGNVLVPLGYTQTAGVTRLSGGGTISASNGTTLNTITISGGRLEATGTISANVANSGTIAPGTPTGTLAITGDLTLAATTNLQMDLGGKIQGTGYDSIQEAGNAALNLQGALSLTLLNGFVPAAADSLIILSSNQPLTGTFSNVVAGHVLASDGITSLRVSVIGKHVVVGQLPGDYTGNGVDDTADYVVWRKGLGTTYVQGHYDIWRANFGATAGSGSGSALESPSQSAVPEPASAMLLLLGFVIVGMSVRGRSSWCELAQNSLPLRSTGDATDNSNTCGGSHR